MRRQLVGPDELTEALESDLPVRVVLLRRELPVPAAVEAARASGATLRRVSAQVLRRLTNHGRAADLLAMVGPDPRCSLAELCDREGPVWLLDGLAYPGNTGFALRQAEVSGAAGVVVDDARLDGGRRRVLRASMRADWFLPVLWHSAAETLAAARGAGREIVVVEHGGDAAPWDVDLTGRPLLVVGNERDGVSASTRDAADRLVQLPMQGFIPSYNVQAAMAAVTAERLRQL